MTHSIEASRGAATMFSIPCTYLSDREGSQAQWKLENNSQYCDRTEPNESTKESVTIRSNRATTRRRD